MIIFEKKMPSISDLINQCTKCYLINLDFEKIFDILPRKLFLIKINFQM